ncbi:MULTISPECIES: hypothetical protein [unclassified Micromonospora]|uniref:hypothetical protein n=1 Tax=unclassified Micromonospora TaxID=2617518 RepID=UPI0010339692|nr:MULTISPECIES: hypothetical protein [unclassified Micromonospora]QKW11449.1 hypothetical protein HUT12_00700 [Verrucosispora sp. NA02020]TBL29520.1 hypothetical protein EYA84_24325 [Verrucosispora sp. SN26_14.1]
MSYPEQAPPRRPAVVVTAVVVLVVMAVGAFGYAVTGLSAVGGTVSRFRAAAVGTSADSAQVDAMVTLLRGVVVGAAVLSVLAALLLAGLAVGLAGRRPAARVSTWVVAGLGALLGCCGIGALLIQRATPLDFGDDQAAAELVALVADAYPSWWIPVTTTLSVGQVLGYLVVAVLLAMPSANAWFRRHPVPPHHPHPPHHPPSAYPPPVAPHQTYPPPGAPPSSPYPPR